MKRSYRLLLSVLSGILLSLAWLGFPGWTLFVAFIPLLWLDRFFVIQKKNFRSVSFFGHAFLAVLIWNVLTTFWVANATLAGALMAFIINSAAMSVVWWLAHIARRNFKANLGYVALAAFWISFEYIHYHWDIEWPWLHLGNGFANNVQLIQWYEYTGVFGGTLWVLVMNVLLFKTILSIKQKSSVKNTVYIISASVFVLVAPIIFSLITYSSYVEKVNPKEVVIVQPNVDPYSESYDFSAELLKMEKFLQLAKQETTNNTDFVVGPETVFENPGYWNEANLQSNRFIQEFSAFSRSYNNTEMVFGVSSYKIYPDKNSAPITARSNGKTVYDRFNTAIFLDRKGACQIYHKSKLVVGVEKMPFMKYLGFINDIVINIGGTTGSLGHQSEPSNFISKDGTQVAPVICYESVFGEYVAGYVRKGAELIFIITNDGWWKNTPGYKQHLSYARLRAIETRRSIARAANTGISCFINQRGDVLQPTSWWVETSINGTINANNVITFYVMYGNYIARISLFISILLLLDLVVKRAIKR